MWGLIDNFLLKICVVFEIVFILFFNLLFMILNFFVAIIDLVFRPKKRTGFGLQNKEKFFNKQGVFFSNLSELLTSFSIYLKNHSIFRRYFFLFIGFVILFIYNPPSHWGPWYKYEQGYASYYSTGFWFKRTSSGERFMPFAYTAAHRTLPFGTTVKVKNISSGKYVFVRITDRGPFKKGRIIDLSEQAANHIGIKKNGTGRIMIFTRRHFKH
jgi:rare lipoprotein A